MRPKPGTTQPASTPQRGPLASSRQPPGIVAAHLLRDGLDFVWRAANGSEAIAHWMPGGYSPSAFRPQGTSW